MHLIVSKNKKTWASNSPKLFAGLWCFPKKKSNKLHILYDGKLDINHANIDEEWKKIFEYKNKLFPLNCSVLNDYKNEKNSERYYRIIIGHWFDYAVEILFHKISLAITLKEIYDYKSFSCIYSENYNIAPYSESEFMDAHFDDRWNQALFGAILERLNFSDLKIKKFIDNEVSTFAIAKKDTNLFRKSLSIINNILNRFSSNNDALIINSYLPFFEEFKLKLYLKQTPIITRRSSFNKEFNYDTDVRNQLTNKLLSNIDEKDTIFYCISKMIFLIFPIIFLEGFTDIKMFVDKLNWPKNPKFIFTSNNFFADNVFKLWTAQKINKKIKFFAGQHGPYWLQINSINNKVYSSCEEITADKLVSNGVNNLNNKISGIYFPIPKPKKLSYDKTGNISLIVPPLAYFGYKKSWSRVYWDNFIEYEAWTNKITELFESLDSKIQKKFRLRLYTHISQHNFINKIWKKKIGNRNIYSDNHSIKKIYKKSKIVIICFESRSLQETMIQNVPSLVLFDDFMIKQMRQENLESFNILKKAGILFSDFYKISDFLNKNSDVIEVWWNTPDIQNARHEFLEKYSRTTRSPAKYLSKLIQENL